MSNSNTTATNYKSNTLWLLSERSIRIIVGLIANVLIARHLGAAGYGVLSFAISLVSVFLVLSNLGLIDILVKQILSDAKREHVTLGTSFFLIFIVSLICVAINSIIAMQIVNADSRFILLIIGISLLFSSSTIFEAHFQAHVKGKYVAAAKLTSLTAGFLIKILLLINDAPIIWFAWSIVLDSILLFISLIGTYFISNRNLVLWSLNKNLALELLRQSWPLLLSGLFITVYMKIDQVMIQHYLGPQAVGHYAVAVQISQAWYFVPVLISTSFFPAILKLQNDKKAYHAEIQYLYRLTCGIGFAVAVMVTIFSEQLVILLFTAEFAPAAEVLVIHIWAGVFVGLGTVGGKWLVAENLQKHAFYRAGCGALLNVALNVILIPPFGIVGAAIATLVAQCFATYLYDVLSDDTRTAFFMKSKALLYPIPRSISKR